MQPGVPPQPQQIPYGAPQPQYAPAPDPHHPGQTIPAGAVIVQQGGGGGGAGLIVIIVIGVVVVLVAVTVVLAGVLYVWANNLAAEGTVTTASTLNTYGADDALDNASSGTSDILIQLQMTGADTLSWTFTQIQLTVGDTVTKCSLVEGTDGDGCYIDQQGGDLGTAWEPGEFVYLSESGTDICSTDGCNVGISVMYNGNTVAGDEGVIVN